MLNTEHQKKYWLLSFYRFFFFFFFFGKRFLISQLIRIHILFHIQMGPSTRRPQEGGGYSDLFFISRLGPRIYRSPPKKISRLSSTPKNILHTPQKVFILLKTKTILKFSILIPQKWPKPTYV